MPTKSRRGRQTPPELELQVIVSSLKWVLETELKSSASTVFPVN